MRTEAAGAQRVLWYPRQSKAPVFKGINMPETCTGLKYTLLGHTQVRAAVAKDCHLTKEWKMHLVWAKTKATAPAHPYLDLLGKKAP